MAASYLKHTVFEELVHHIHNRILFKHCRVRYHSYRTMKNDEGIVVDLYIPRKCSWTNKLITAKDHRSVQINIGHLDESGVYTNSFSTFALCGQVRSRGDADSALDNLWTKARTQIGQ